MIADVMLVGVGLLVGAVGAWLAADRRMGELERAKAAQEGTIAALERDAQERVQILADLQNQLTSERSERVAAVTRMEAMDQQLASEKLLLEEAKAKLSDAFKSLAGDTLASSNRSFLELAKETFSQVLADARGDLGKREQAIKGLVDPLTTSLKQFEEHVRGLERTRQEAYTSLDEQLKALLGAQQQLQRETGSLVAALRSPQVRGRWGEITLRRVVELAGMSDHCDFTEQTSTETETGRIRPDMIVHLPGERQVVVDSKVSLEAYLAAQSAHTEEERESHLAAHARQIRAHMNSLGGKAYWNQFDQTPEFVVMFIPGEPFFAAAADQDRSLIEDGMQKRIVIATPTTFIALLRAVAYGWRQEQVGKNARHISELGRQLYDRMRVMADHLGRIGKGLGTATDSYNKAVSSMEARVLPAARRFRDLGAGTSDEIGMVEPVGTTPREVAAAG